MIQSDKLDIIHPDSCRNCVHFRDEPTRCVEKGYEFYREEEIRETGTHCWAFRFNIECELFLTQQKEKIEK